MLDKSRIQALPENWQEDQIKRFDEMAEQWWDPKGKYKNVLAFNNVRSEFIKRQILDFFKLNNDDPQPLKGYSILDVGCGGGLLCEPLAQLGAKVTGIDGSQLSLVVAQHHAAQNNLEIEYINTLAHDFRKEGREFDIVLNTEVIEHVYEQESLLTDCHEMLKENGLFVSATLNRTVKSFLFGILGAEYILRLLPKGTHDWRMFVKPEELLHILHELGCELVSHAGMAFNPFTGNWKITRDVSVNYLLLATK